MEVTKMFYQNRAVGQSQGLPLQNYVYDSSLPNQTYFDSRQEGQSVNPVDVDYYNKTYEENTPKLYGAEDALKRVINDDDPAKVGNARWIQKSPGTLALSSLPAGGSVVPGFEEGRKIGYGAEDSATGFPYQRWMQTKPGTVERKMNRGGSVAPGFDSGRAVGYGTDVNSPWMRWAILGAGGLVLYWLIAKLVLKKKKVFSASGFKLNKAWDKFLN